MDAGLLTLKASTLYSWVATVLLPFVRIGSVFMSMPFLGTQMVPTTIRLLFSIAVTFIIVPNVPTITNLDVFSFNTMILVAQQVVIGIAIGFALQMVFQAFILGGQIIAMQAGLGYASMMDPQNGVSVPVVSQIYSLLLTLVFLSLNGHLTVINMLAESFTTLPIGKAFIGVDGFWQLVIWGMWIFKGAVIVALPAIASLLLVNLSFGIMTRAAPQMNIFAIGFPITLMVGLFIIYITINAIIPKMINMMDLGFKLIESLLGT